MGRSRKVDLPELLVDELREYVVRIRNEMLQNVSGEETDLLCPDSDKGNRRKGPMSKPPLLQLFELSTLKDVSGEESSRL